MSGILRGERPASMGLVRVYRGEDGWTYGSSTPAIRSQDPVETVAKEMRQAGLEVVDA